MLRKSQFFLQTGYFDDYNLSSPDSARKQGVLTWQKVSCIFLLICTIYKLGENHQLLSHLKSDRFSEP
ncbi:hypothetical protein [Calothrix sp. 336/3]|uniref:hypothetical protein n=1 Tax=Calothrix sp. 336/3 TaxID=1337936 RepID=UPI001438CB4C|nr:hypothetical protein [Calothrix sp. 336/3]